MPKFSAPLFAGAGNVWWASDKDPSGLTSQTATNPGAFVAVTPFTSANSLLPSLEKRIVLELENVPLLTGGVVWAKFNRRLVFGIMTKPEGVDWKHCTPLTLPPLRTQTMMLEDLVQLNELMHLPFPV